MLRLAILTVFLTAAPLAAGTAVPSSAFAQPERAQGSPLGVPAPSGGTAPQSRRASPGDGLSASPAGGFWRWVQATQRDLHRRLAAAIKRLKQGGGPAAGWLLAGLSFLYGVVHAAGPGHGKAVISSYILANERTARRGILLGFLSSLVQAFSAVALVGILAVLLNAAGLQIKHAARALETASYALVAVIGAWLLFSQARRIWTGGTRTGTSRTGTHEPHDHAACCGHAHLPDARQIERAGDWRSAAAIVLAVGLRPCTGAILVLVFALANGLFLAGVGATFAMALGTAITVSALAVLAVGSRETAIRLAGSGSVWAERIFNTAALLGAGLVLLLGGVLFAGSLGPARPF